MDHKPAYLRKNSVFNYYTYIVALYFNVIKIVLIFSLQFELMTIKRVLLF